jgi:hydrogenase maturation protease
VAEGPNEALVLGIGNVLWADEGFGVRAVEALHEAYAFPAGVELMDGGTQGLNLMGPVTSARRVLVLDAIDFALPPGTLKVLRGREVPAWAAGKMSLHQQSFQELLAIMDLQDRFPAVLTLVGVQPERLSDFGGSLTDIVRRCVAPAVEAAAHELAAWGLAGVPRIAGDPAARLNADALALDAYEGGRPTADAACRVGDPRFLNIRAASERRGDAMEPH